MSHSGSIASLLLSVRSRSRSKTTASDLDPLALKEETPYTSWFGKACDFIRPWEDNDEEEIPEEQKLAFTRTSEAVGITLKRLAGQAGNIAVEALVSSMELMDYVPFPALQGVAKVFIKIWQAVQQVSMNRLAFLRLTQTCTTILDAILSEVEASGEQVMRDLSGPILVLERSFESFLSLVRSQVELPFLARYLKRDDTTKAIATCNDSLLRALTLFTTTIQIRTYQAVCANAQLCAANYSHMMETMGQGFKARAAASDTQLPVEQQKRCSAPNYVDDFPQSSSHRIVGIPESPTVVSRSTDDLLPKPQVMPVLQQLQTAQNSEDTKSDMEDLRRLIRAALESGSDAKLLSFLGIEKEEMPEAIKTLQRSLEKRTTTGEETPMDTLHEEFLETGIEALRRMSAGNSFVTNLPVWTITKYEVERKRKIGMGFFSEVFQGTWKGRTVAIKVLSEVTPSDLFVREIKVWKSLVHPNVLKLYGASSATGSHPWFFVSPYMRNGNLVEFLKRISQREDSELQGLGSIAENLPSSRSRGIYGKAFTKILKISDVYRILQEIAKGMEYLHKMNVLHGDLKASNVLVDDNCRCVISDFGQSEMKSEVCRITGSSMQTGTLRWKAPELLDGSSGMLTTATDIYAYAIVCVEVLTMGNLPWAHDDDDDVRYNVLERDRRPLIPPDFTSPLLHELISACWIRDPTLRAPFAETVTKLQRLRTIAGEGADPSIGDDDYAPLSPHLSRSTPTVTPYSTHQESFDALDDFVALPSAQEVDALRQEESTYSDSVKMPEPVHYSSSLRRKFSRRIGPIYGGEADTSFASRPYSSVNNNFMEARNERRYRFLLEHEYHQSLTLPLWEPTCVHIGDVGYLSKPSGKFITLFNSIQKNKLSSGRFPNGLLPMNSFGDVSKGNVRLDKRNVAQKGLDAVSGLLAFRGRGEMPISKHHAFRLRAGHASAHIYTELGEYHYIKTLDTPKAWFQANVETILQIFGKDHNIQKEDLYLVVSLLQAPNYALLVSHQHPDAQAHFNIFSNPRKGKSWGSFTTEVLVPGGQFVPLSSETPEGEPFEYTSKISNANDPPKAVLLGRLRFKPDSSEPTTAK
ncbi:hypothetical protein CPC08DRAFT_633569 [Agrocybe pediades]|nr:hypothetical protein CPC08DRAFT_633569 [Agrocybe pediades]